MNRLNRVMESRQGIGHIENPIEILSSFTLFTLFTLFNEIEEEWGMSWGEVRTGPPVIEYDEAEPIVASSSLEFLQKVYADPAQPISRRMRAAIAALPFEHPKLAVVASIGPNSGFAAQLEEAFARSRKVIEASASNEDSPERS